MSLSIVVIAVVAAVLVVVVILLFMGERVARRQKDPRGFEVMTKCPKCGGAKAGNYCAKCGEKL